MQITPINSYQNQQSFQAGKLKIGDSKPIPYADLGEILYELKTNGRGKQTGIVTLLDSAGETLKKFKRSSAECATFIYEKLQMAKRLTKEAPSGQVVDFIRIDDRALRLKHSCEAVTFVTGRMPDALPLVIEDSSGHIKSLPSEKLGEVAVMRSNKAGKSSCRIILCSEEIDGHRKILWSSNVDDNKAEAAANALRKAVQRAQDNEFGGKEVRFNLEKVSDKVSSERLQDLRAAI